MRWQKGTRSRRVLKQGVDFILSAREVLGAGNI
jgi:hypothetical protein